MVRGGRKIRFRSPKVRFYSNTKLPTNVTSKSEKLLDSVIFEFRFYPCKARNVT
jgi:hypothetical protein